jgi:citrate lyase subunit beta/citryl-CoA lyase
MLAKARTLPADEVVIDLEDAVVPAQKEAARAMTVAALRADGWHTRSIAVRVNGTGTPWFERDVRDLAANAGEALGTIVLPKAETASGLEQVELLLESAEGRGPRSRPLGLQALIETARGLVHVNEIAAASPRLEALIIGYADLAASLGRPPGQPHDPDRWSWTLDAVVVAARAAGIQAIDGPHLQIADLDGLRQAAARARELGYDGKWALHPSQVDPLVEIFSPSAEELDAARAILSTLEQAEGEGGAGAAMLDGEMVDEASRKLAQQVLARAPDGD